MLYSCFLYITRVADLTKIHPDPSCFELDFFFIYNALPHTLTCCGTATRSLSTATRRSSRQDHNGLVLRRRLPRSPQTTCRWPHCRSERVERELTRRALLFPSRDAGQKTLIPALLRARHGFPGSLSFCHTIVIVARAVKVAKTAQKRVRGAAATSTGATATSLTK